MFATEEDESDIEDAPLRFFEFFLKPTIKNTLELGNAATSTAVNDFPYETNVSPS
jgi:hypothetical protein